MRCRRCATTSAQPRSRRASIATTTVRNSNTGDCCSGPASSSAPGWCCSRRSSRLLPGEVIPAAYLAHSQEGLMAFLVVIVWHIYNAHLSPDVFPFDTSIFSGRISAERMRHEHPLEYERLQPAEAERERTVA